MRLVASVLTLAMVSSGCAAGNTRRYDSVLASLSYQGTRRVAVGTEDLRPYVLNAEKGPQCVGLSRGGYGNPFNVTTTSGKLADDLTLSLERSLDARGFDAVALTIGLREADAAVVAKAKETGATRVVVLLLREWKSDTMMNTVLIYEAALRVLDAPGEVLAESKIAGRDGVGPPCSAVHPSGDHARCAGGPSGHFGAASDSLIHERVSQCFGGPGASSTPQQSANWSAHAPKREAHDHQAHPVTQAARLRSRELTRKVDTSGLSLTCMSWGVDRGWA